MRAHRLLVTPPLRLKAKRTPRRSKPKPIRPHEWWGINMTKVLVQGLGWVSIVIGLGRYTKAMVGYDTDLQCTAKHWMAAVDMAVNQ